jgi:hypothetical protein
MEGARGMEYVKGRKLLYTKNGRAFCLIIGQVKVGKGKREKGRRSIRNHSDRRGAELCEAEGMEGLERAWHLPLWPGEGQNLW